MGLPMRFPYVIFPMRPPDYSPLNLKTSTSWNLTTDELRASTRTGLGGYGG